MARFPGKALTDGNVPAADTQTRDELTKIKTSSFAGVSNLAAVYDDGRVRYEAEH
jgi:hypothetical protein